MKEATRSKDMLSVFAQCDGPIACCMAHQFKKSWPTHCLGHYSSRTPYWVHTILDACASKLRHGPHPVRLTRLLPELSTDASHLVAGKSNKGPDPARPHCPGPPFCQSSLPV